MGELQYGTLHFGPRGRSRYKGSLVQCRAEGNGDVIPDEADDAVLQVCIRVCAGRRTTRLRVMRGSCWHPLPLSHLP
jgi:hypothetical protein